MASRHNASIRASYLEGVSPYPTSMRQRVTAGLLLMLPLVVPLYAAAVDFYVSPTGNDSSLGTQQAPLRTLDGTRDAVRRERAGGHSFPVTISVLPGVYELTRSFELDE